jgi:hypothetical protein
MGDGEFPDPRKRTFCIQDQEELFIENGFDASKKTPLSNSIFLQLLLAFVLVVLVPALSIGAVST